jgi:magnesium transporter
MNELEILQLIESKQYKQLKSILSEMNEVDIAEILDPLDTNTTLLIFRMLPKDLAVEVFAHFSTEQQREIINAVTDKELTYILDELFFDDMIDIIEEMPSNIVNKILKNSTQEERNLINQFLKYPESSAGSLMTIEYVELRKTMIVKEALAHLKETGLNKETIYTCYVTDKKRTLEGIVSLRTLVTSDDDVLISDIMQDEVIFVNTHDDQETVANVFKKYGFLALPVVDNENRLTGIITVDDIVDVMEQEATEDFQRMAAMAPSDVAYLDTSVFNLAKHRITWLLILMLSATFTGRIIAKFNEVLQSVVILASFIPMLMDTGGNSGNQSSTLIIRGLATGEIELKDKFKVLWKEFRVGIIVGITLSITNFIRLLVIEKVELKVALTVSLTLIVTVLMAKMVGGVLPIIAKTLKIDPAIMAGPLITTLVDAISLTVYFSIATLLLGI